METISFIIKLLNAITLLFFVTLLILDIKKRYSLKIGYAKFICVLVLILLHIADLIIRIITKEDIASAIFIIILWGANLILSIISIKSYKVIISTKETLAELQNKTENSINCE